MKKIALMAAASVLAVNSASAQEATAPVDLSSLSDAVDFSAVNTAVLAIAAAIISVLVVMRGIRWVFSMVR